MNCFKINSYWTTWNHFWGLCTSERIICPSGAKGACHHSLSTSPVIIDFRLSQVILGTGFDFPIQLNEAKNPRLKICLLYIFRNKPPHILPIYLNIGETRVCRLDSGPNLQPCRSLLPLVCHVSFPIQLNEPEVKLHTSKLKPCYLAKFCRGHIWMDIVLCNIIFLTLPKKVVQLSPESLMSH